MGQLDNSIMTQWYYLVLHGGLLEAIWWLHLILGCLDILWSWIGRSSYFSEKVFKMVSEVKKKAKKRE